jgi:ABC-type sugar transport system ATPase subunit
VTVNDAEPLLRLRGIGKNFGPVHALTDINLDIPAGQVTALVGDNGAGKSTLLKILCGALRPTSGTILVDGEEVNFHSPRDSRSRGIEVVYQDLALATELSVTENVFLGRERRRSGPIGRLRVLDWPSMAKEAGGVLDSLGIKIDDVRARCGLLSGGQRQAVAVARAIMWGSKVLLLDEPTAALAVMEQQKISALITEVKKQNVGVVLVSHNLRQVHDLSDRVVVLLHGQMVANLRPQDVSVEDMVRWITGVALETSVPASTGA